MELNAEAIEFLNVFTKPHTTGEPPSVSTLLMKHISGLTQTHHYS